MDQLRATIDSLCVDAKVLLLRAQHEELKAHVRSAQRELTEALTLLEQRHTSTVHSLLMGVVDAAVKSAALRLQMVESALRTDGPSARDIS